MENGDRPIWDFIKREIWLITIVIGAVLAIYVPLSDIKMELAVLQSQNAQILKELQENKTDIASIRKEFNSTFADIYSRLGR